MTLNLHARESFEKGDLGRATGHTVSKPGGVESNGSFLVTALQDVKAGMNGWFEDMRTAK